MEDASFEETLEALERKVEELGEGKLALEDALRTFQEGVEMYRRCNRALLEAEQKVSKLVGPADAPVEEPLA